MLYPLTVYSRCYVFASVRTCPMLYPLTLYCCYGYVSVCQCENMSHVVSTDCILSLLLRVCQCENMSHVVSTDFVVSFIQLW